MSPKLKGTLCACTCVCIWTGFILISRYGAKTNLKAFDLAALRFSVASLILLPVFLRRRYAGLGSSQIMTLVFTGGVGYALFAYSGFMFAPAAHGAILSPGALPFFTAFAVWIFLDERPSPSRWIGLGLIATGAVLVGWHSFASPAVGAKQWLGDLLFLGSAASWATFATLTRKWGVNPLTNVAQVSVTSALLYLPVYFLFLPSYIADAPVGDLVVQSIYQGIFAVVIAMICYGTAINTIGPSKTSVIVAAVPVTASLLAVPLLNESLPLATIAGLIVVSVGILIGTGVLNAWFARSEIPAAQK